MIDPDTVRGLSPCLMHWDSMRALIVRQKELYAEDRSSEARRVLAQSLLWTAGVAVFSRRPVGRGLDIRRAKKLWNVAAPMAGKELQSELTLDPELDTDVFMAALATEYSRLLQGPDIERLRAVHHSELLEKREDFIPRESAVSLYGTRLVPDETAKKLVQHAAWLSTVAEKGLL